MENRTLQYYLQSLMPQETLPEEVEDQIHTCFQMTKSQNTKAVFRSLITGTRASRGFSRGRIPSARMP